MLAEVQAYLEMIEEVRGQVVKLLAEVATGSLEAEALNWRPLAGDDHATNSLAILGAHVAGSEHFWIGETVGGREATRVRADEFRTELDGVEELLQQLAAVGEETREVLEGLDEAALGGTREVPAGPGRVREVGVRWAILHVIEHSAMHLGHMQLTRQLWLAQRGA